MKKIEINELKKIQLNILKYLDEFCKKNNIKYWIDCGTLLGAIRHKGYIPWDDDIDVGMLREDYDKFIELSESFNSSKKYSFNCYELNHNWQYSMGKVLDNDTILYEPDVKNGIKTCVNIDIFVYDIAPIDDSKLNKMYNKRDFFVKLNSCRNIKRFYTKDEQKYNFIKIAIYYILHIFPKGFFVKKIIINSKKLCKYDTGYVGNFTANTRMKCSTKVFKSFIDVKFENEKFPAPIGYDEWLKAFFGNYMELPPKEKQISHHIFEAYYK